MKRQRYERTDVPKGGPRATVIALIALVLIAAGGWFLVQALWARAKFDSYRGDATLASSVSTPEELKSIDGYVTSDHIFDNVLLLVVDDVDAEAPVLADAKILCLDITAGSGTLVTLPTDVRVNPESNPQHLADLLAGSGASACVSAVQRRCGIPITHVIMTDATGWESLQGLDGIGAQELTGRIMGLLSHMHTDMDAPGLIEFDERLQAVGFGNIAQLDMRPGSEWTDDAGVVWNVVHDYEVAPAIGYLVPA